MQTSGMTTRRRPYIRNGEIVYEDVPAPGPTRASNSAVVRSIFSSSSPASNGNDSPPPQHLPNGSPPEDPLPPQTPDWFGLRGMQPRFVIGIACGILYFLAIKMAGAQWGIWLVILGVLALVRHESCSLFTTKLDDEYNGERLCLEGFQ